MKSFFYPWALTRLLQVAAIALLGLTAATSSAKIVAVCGPAAAWSNPLTSPPTNSPPGNLCTYGAPTSVVVNFSGEYQWTCTTAAAPPIDPMPVSIICYNGPGKTKQDGVCGAANNTSVSGTPQPMPAGNLCASLAPAKNMYGTSYKNGGTQYTWTCPGTKGGAPITCHANSKPPKDTGGDLTHRTKSTD